MTHEQHGLEWYRSTQNTYFLHQIQQYYMMGSCLNVRCRTADTEEPCIRRADYKLFSDFQFCRQLEALAPNCSRVNCIPIKWSHRTIVKIKWDNLYNFYHIPNFISNVSLSLFFFWCSCRIFVPWPGNKPMPPAVEEQSLNHWVTREVLQTPPFHRRNTGQIGDSSHGPRKLYHEGHLPSHLNETTKMPKLPLQHLGNEVSIFKVEYTHL